MTLLVRLLAVAFLLASASVGALAEQPGELLPMPKPPAPNGSCCAASCAKACPVGKPLATFKELEIAKTLDQPVALQFKAMPLRCVIDELRSMTGLNIVPDLAALEDQAISCDRPVTIQLQNVSLKGALAAILNQLRLTYVIRDEMVQITTPEKAKGKLVQKTYAVADLVVPVRSSAACDTEKRECCKTPPAPAGAASCCVRNPGNTTEDVLIQTIINTVSPQSWSAAGGAGTICYFPLAYAIVVDQTLDIHEQVAELLAALRRLQDNEVVLETILLTTSDMNLVARHFGNADANAKPGAAFWFLSKEQLRDVLEEAQKQPQSSVMQTPKMTLFNGQSADCKIVDTQRFVTGVDIVPERGKPVYRPRTEDVAAGISVSYQPKISADRRFVKVGFNVSKTTIASVSQVPIKAVRHPDLAANDVLPCTFNVQLPQVDTQSVAKAVNVPDGCTAAFLGWTNRRVGRNEFGPPILSCLPYIGHMFKTSSYDAAVDYTYVLVTPRIIIREEEEAIQTAYSAPPPLAQQLKNASSIPMPPKCCTKVAAAPCELKAVACWEKPSKDSCQRGAEASAKRSGCCGSVNSCGSSHVFKLLEIYHQACAQGQADLAKKLATLAIEMDPTCFGRCAGRE